MIYIHVILFLLFFSPGRSYLVPRHTVKSNNVKVLKVGSPTMFPERRHGSIFMNTMPRDDPPDPERYKKAVINSIISVISASAFGAGIGIFLGSNAAVEYFAGYVVEQSLSVDNLFVFLLLFDYFNVPISYQDRVLRWGIIGAVVFRGIFIALGEAAMELFHPVILIFASILMLSAFKLFNEDGEEDVNLNDNAVVQLSTKVLNATDKYDRDRFFTIVDGVKRATPLLVVLLCVELSDLIFAVDSIPAVFGVTKQPLIVYTSNLFAILNLRSLYTVLSNAVGDLVYLKPAVGLVLGFVGAKLDAEYFGYKVDTVLSLCIISALLSGGVVLSLLEQNREDKRIL